MGQFTGLHGIDRDRLLALIAASRALRTEAEARPRTDRLHGKAIGLLFFEPSTRTRFSFEMACHRLGADPLAFNAASSSSVKGESLTDTARVLKAVGADALVVRHKEVGAADLVAEVVGLPVVNAGDGTGEHPTQALLDLVTMSDHVGGFEGLTVGIVGDIRHSRVARSNAYGLRALGARVLLAGPPSLQDATLLQAGCEQRQTLAEVAPEADVLMMLRIQRERIAGAAVPSVADYRARWGLTERAAAQLQDHVIVMHPGPMNRGVEIDDEVADGPRSVIYGQMVNGVYARMAVLLDVLGVEAPEAVAG